MAAAAVALAAVGLALNVVPAIESAGVASWDRLPRRFWEDVHMAEGLYAFGEFPVRVNELIRFRDEAGTSRVRELHPHFERMTEETPVRPWEFWKTIRRGRFLRPEWRQFVDRYDDSGRPLLVAAGYALAGGIAPMMLFWIAPLLAVPVLAWTASELVWAGRTTAGVVLVLLVGASPFVAGALAMPYSTAGFHVLAVLSGIPLLVHAALHPRPSERSLAWRAALTGLVMAVCLLARGGALLTMGGPLIAVVAGALRIVGGMRPGAARVLRIVAAGALLLILPFVAAQAIVARVVARTAARYGAASVSPQRHAFWFGMWTGLGDFDREKGHRWLDSEASAAGVAAGGTPLRSDGYDPANEVVFRRLVLASVVGDPAWYARILVQRTVATVAQRKLWPWTPVSGRSLAQARHPAEKPVDSYYTLAPEADRLGWGRVQAELPVPLLAAPALALLVLALRRGGSALPAAVVLLGMSAAVLPLPVLVTTAGAIETEAFVLVYFAGWALAADLLTARTSLPRTRDRSRP